MTEAQVLSARGDARGSSPAVKIALEERDEATKVARRSRSWEAGSS